MAPRPTVALLLVVALAVSHHGAARAGADRSGLPVVSNGRASSIVALRAEGPSRILIRAGTFTMGSTREENEAAVALCKRDWPEELCEKAFVNEFEAHEVTLSAYYIDRTEVTVAAYKRCVE